MPNITTLSNPVAPDSPTGFAATAVGIDVHLSWTNPDANFAKARLFRSETNDFGGASAVATVAGIAGQKSTHTDTTPVSGTYYYWAVSLNDSLVASVPTASLSVTTTP